MPTQITPMLACTREEALAAARVLSRTDEAANRFRSWVIDLDGQYVGSKWLAGTLAGMKPHQLTTYQANQALHRIGIEAFQLSEDRY